MYCISKTNVVREMLLCSSSVKVQFLNNVSFEQFMYDYKLTCVL